MRRIPVQRSSAAPPLLAADAVHPTPPDEKVATGQYAPGTLTLVPMPIGNPDDISLRALKTLRAAAYIAVESLAVSRSLMAQWSIDTPLLSYCGRDGRRNHAKLLSLLQAGQNIALICDAGTPGIADPCLLLVRAALKHNLTVTALPGPVAALVALTASGFPTDRFIFEGFPPRNSDARSKFFLQLACESRTVVLYERPAALKTTLLALHQLFGSTRQMTLAWNLTLAVETWVRGTPEQILAQIRPQHRRGQFTIVISGRAG